jgi:hypothetical protein
VTWRLREAWYRWYHRKIPTAARSAGGTSKKRPKSLQEETPRYNARDVDADEAAKAAGGVTTHLNANSGDSC